MENNIIVYESCRNLRALGREALKGRWGLAALGTLLYLALILVPVFILNAIFGPDDMGNSGVSTIYSIIVSGPMTLGYTMFAISIFRKRETSAAEVFYGFEKFGKALGLYIVMSVLVFLWTLLFIIPGIIAAFRYSMCFFILADNPNIGIKEALNQSKWMMKGNKWKIFCLNLSFIGWGILCIFTLGIGMIWLTPYVQVSITAFYEIVNGNLRVNRQDAAIGYIPNQSDKNSIVDPITVYRNELNNNEFDTRDNDINENDNKFDSNNDDK